MTKPNPPKLVIPSSAGVAEDDDPLTPAGRLFLHPGLDTIIHCVVGVEHYVDIQTIKSMVKDVFISKQPRFSSLLVRKGSREFWRKTEVDIDRHFVVVDSSGPPEDFDRAVNDYVAKLSVSVPLSLDKPLWEVHVMVNYRCAVFRIHHALGDGISLMALLLGGCRKVSDQTSVVFPEVSKPKKSPLKEGFWRRFFAALKYALFSFLFCVEFLLRSLVVGDPRTAISGGEGIELWPRKLATARFSIADMKAVKNAIPRATINDVLLGVISAGLTRYLGHHSDKRLEKGLRLTGVAMINLREQSGNQELSVMMKKSSRARWGNKFGMLLLPVHCNKNVDHPFDYVVKCKTMIDAKKRSIEAHFSYGIGNLMMTLFGLKFVFMTYYKAMCNTSFTISNIMGPEERIAIDGNPIKFLRVSTSSLPHSLTMHMLSYAGRADMQIMAAKDIIPDPEFLAKCFEDALLEMKEAALSSA